MAKRGGGLKSGVAQETFGLSAKDLRTLRALATPVRIQKFVDALTYQYADTAGSPQRANATVSRARQRRPRPEPLLKI